MAAIIAVFEFPPNAFYKILVSFDSQYGTTAFDAFPYDFSARTEITFPRKLNDLLIFDPSVNHSPVAPESFYHSLPAKSTRLMSDFF